MLQQTAAVRVKEAGGKMGKVDRRNFCSAL